MFSMSLKSVPGCLVSIAPRFIGVPVAATPGFVPQADALTVGVEAVAEPAVDAGVPPVLDELRLLQPPRTPPTASTAIAKATGDERLCSFLFICVRLLVSF
jgi:hypothetical protein